MRSNIFGKAMALNGDKTTTGAICIATIQVVNSHQKMALRVGDPTTSCPKCGQVGKIVTGENRINNHGKAQAVNGSIVQCGCPLGSNVVIATTPYVNAISSNATIPILSHESESKVSNQANNLHMPPIINIEPRYTVTIYLAYPGTPLNDNYGKPRIENGVHLVSSFGHMWYQISKISDTQNQSFSYGFAPIYSGVTGRGEVSKYDSIHYINPYYVRTFEVTEIQYNKLKEFGDMAIKRSEVYFNLYYDGLTNSCINFTWKALRHAGLNPPVLECESIHDYCDSTRLALDKKENKFNGEIMVGDNQIHVRAIPAPYPDSELNKEIKNPVPIQSMRQKMMSGLDPDGYKKTKPLVSDNPIHNPNYGADQFFNDWGKHSR